LTTAAVPVPPHKRKRGYRHLREKFRHANLNASASDTVSAPRVAECPVAMEAVVENVHPLAADDPDQRGQVVIFEARVTRVHAHKDILANGSGDHINPDAWRPLIMSFQKFYGLGSQLHPSLLATVPERLYRTADVDRASA
jgi:flavin reductase (DIM6/NTAB) family NADH-FMN oxidoreductase RutF